MRPRLSHPTVLVPGYGTGNAQFIPFRSWLRAHGIDAECWSGAPLLYAGTMASHAARLADDLVRFPHHRFVLVGWSYGGYVAALAARDPRLAGRVKRLIAFATPYDGTWLARAGAFVDRFGLHASEMIPGAPALDRVADALREPRRWDFRSLNGTRDALAPPPQRNVPEATRIEGPWRHVSLLYDVSLFRLIHRLIVAP